MSFLIELKKFKEIKKNKPFKVNYPPLKRQACKSLG